jgi:hypothetical protein
MNLFILFCKTVLLFFMWLLGVASASLDDENTTITNNNDNEYVRSIPRYHDLNTQNLWYCRTLECMSSFSRNNAVCHKRQLIFAGITYNIATDFMFPYFIPWLLHIFGDQNSFDVTVFIMDYYMYGESAGSDIIDQLAISMPSCTSFILFHCHALSISFHPKYLYVFRDSLGFQKHVLIHLSQEVAYDIEQEIPTHICYGNESSMISYYAKYDLVIKQYYYLPFQQYSTYLPLGPQDYHKLVHSRRQYGVRPINQRSHLCMFSGRFYYTTRTPEHRERDEIRRLIDESIFPCMVIPSQDDIYGGPQMSHDRYISMMADAIFIPCPAGSAPETFRLYEALELGSIPILGKPRDSVNFLSEWTDYPGPILSSWSQLNEYFIFLSAIDERDSCQQDDTSNLSTFCHDKIFRDFLDKEASGYMESTSTSRLHRYLNFLQDRMMDWYFAYKAKVSSKILSQIYNIFR